MEIYCIKIDKLLEENELSSIINFTSKKDVESIENLVNNKEKQKSLIADILIRTIICKKLNFMNKEIIFYKNKYGKPFLQNNNSFNFNLSHSGNLVVCAIDNFSVGVDVEKVKNNGLRVAKRFFIKDEYNCIMSRPEAERDLWFYNYWTVKESYIKAIGKGLFIALNSFSIKYKNCNFYIDQSKEDKNYFFKVYDICENYIIAVCAKTKMHPQKIIVNDVKYILSDFKKYI